MKILFVIHQVDYADHIAIAYLSAIAKQLNHSTHLCILKNNDFFDIIRKLMPDVVAYSVNILGYEDIVHAHKEAKKHHDFISIMGGPQATFSPETFDEGGMDAYCVGEGEYAFRDFLLKVSKGEPYDNIPNLITKNGKIPVRPLIRNLDELPPADRDLMLANSFLKNAPKKTFYATRGCPFKCAYCCNDYYHKLYKGKGPIVRRFSVERIIREIEDVRSKYRMNFIKFGDDVFAIKADDWLEEFAEKYSRRIGVFFNCYLRLDTVDDKLLRLLKKAGCFSVHLSVDSTSKYVRDKILTRSMTSEDYIGKIRKIGERGIRTWVNYMLAAPESKLDDDIKTIYESKKAKVTYAAYSTTVPIKRTRLYDYCLEKGYLNPVGYKSDMVGATYKSALTCFSEREKNIRYNIYLLGAVIAKLPPPLSAIALFLIKVIPPNRVFKKIRARVYEYYITNKIFKLT